MDEHLFESHNVSVSGVPLSFRGNMMTEGFPQIVDCEILEVVAIDGGMIRPQSIYDPNTTPMFLVRVCFKGTDIGGHGDDIGEHMDIVTDAEKYSPVFYERKGSTGKEFAIKSRDVMDKELNWADLQRINSMIELLVNDQMHLMEDKTDDSEEES